MKKKSLRSKLIRLFCVTSIIPILVLSFFSYNNISYTIRDNTRDLTNKSLKQIDDNLQIWLESYEDLLYQIYTDDNMVDWVDKINAQTSVSVTKNQIRRYTRGLLNTKEYIRSITIITEDGTVITYDQLTPATYQNSWIKSFNIGIKELYDKVSRDYNMHVFPTQYGTQFANRDYYLFHIAHRIIDYKNLDKKCGIAIVSIDEQFLENICMTTKTGKFEDNTNFIVDDEGRVISYRDKSYIGDKVTDYKKDIDGRIEDYSTYIRKDKQYSTQYTSVYAYHDEKLGWDIVNVTDQSSLMEKLKGQFEIILLLSGLLFAIVIAFTIGMSNKLVSSVHKVTDIMEKTKNGDLSVRVDHDNKMLLEIENIAIQFNDMLSKLDKAIQREREAQIVALEAQINPHFIYNTLDTINWMAIDKNDYDISNAINSLATILRYAIVNNNAQVSVREEIDWLKKYIYLQQFRLKNEFSCSIEVDPIVMEDRIYKLLLQPFIENAIIHGFERGHKNACLKVQINRQDNNLSIIISDNGIGMESSMVESFNNEIFDGGEKGHHIGMENAITRLRMYYGNRGKINISSTLGEGTIINIVVPIENN